MYLSATDPAVDPGLILDAVKWLGGAAAAAVAAWFAMKARQDTHARQIAELEEWREKQETAAKEAREEAERQREAWWKVVDALKDTITTLDKTCSNATTETRALLQSLKERVDLHSTTTVSSLAGVVKNYNDMLHESVEALRQMRKS